MAKRLLAVFLASSLSCCASLKDARIGDVRIGLMELIEHRRDFDGKDVVVHGSLSVDGDAVYLHRNAEAGSGNFADGVDLVSSSRDMLTKEMSGCARVSGRFVAFDADSIGIGNFRSPNGFIEVDGVEREDCRRRR